MGEEIKVKRRSLPQEIVFKILVGLPPKSLMRFNCVSKTWLSIISDPYFVQSHHALSYTRPGGINLIVCTEKHDYSADETIYKVFSTDPQGKSPFKRLTTLPPVPRGGFDLDNLYSVCGLVCVGKCIWNPTTNKSIVLPSFSVPPIDDLEVCFNNRYTAKYFLGFDTSKTAYKVLCIFSCVRTLHRKFGAKICDKQQIQLKILELGGSSWRDIESFPSKLVKDILCTGGSCSMDNLIFFHHDYSSLAAFDLRSEKFDVIPIPDGGYNTDLMQVGERIALINDEIDTIWILEDYKKHQWRSKSIILGLLREVIKFKVKSKISYMEITPFGASHTSNEILLQIKADSKQFFYYYDFNRKTYRIVPKLTQIMDEILDVDASFSLKKHVECIYRLT